MRQIKILDLVIKPDEYSVSRNGQAVNMPKLSFELLIYLVEHVGEICSVEQISEAVWKSTVVSNDTVIQRITLLRKALNDDPKSPKYIESIRGRGYRLLASNSTQSNNFLSHYQSLAAVVVVICLSILVWLYQSQSQIKKPKVQTSKNELIERGNYYLEVGQSDNIERAIELFRQALIHSPNNSDAQLGLSFALSRSVCRYGQSRKRAQESQNLAQSVLDLENNNARAQRALAYSFDCLGYLDAALNAYLNASELSENNQGSISSAAHLYQIKGQLIEAYKLNVKTKKQQPNNPFADLQIARLYELLKFTPQAEAAYQKLFVLYPDNVFINQALPRFLFLEGRFSEAKEAYEKAMARGASRGDTLVNYANLIWLLEGKEPAKIWFQKAAQHNPNDSLVISIQQILDEQLSLEQAKHKIEAIELQVLEGDTWPYNYLEAALLASWVLQDQTQAVQLLQKGLALGYLDSEYLTLSPLFSNLKEIPQFYQLINSINQRREELHQAFLALYPAPQ